LLGQIRKEAARRENEQQVASAVEIAAQAAHTLGLARPLLPAIPFSTRIKSHTARRTFYDVDLNGPTCTCPDFRSYRVGLRMGHQTRCCKHIFDAYAQLEPVEGWSGWLDSFLEVACPPHPHQNWRVVTIGQGWLGMRTALVLISSAPRDWANVFAPSNGIRTLRIQLLRQPWPRQLGEANDGQGPQVGLAGSAGSPFRQRDVRRSLLSARRARTRAGRCGFDGAVCARANGASASTVASAREAGLF
jgi:hypothetical protein